MERKPYYGSEPKRRNTASAARRSDSGSRTGSNRRGAQGGDRLNSSRTQMPSDRRSISGSGKVRSGDAPRTVYSSGSTFADSRHNASRTNQPSSRSAGNRRAVPYASARRSAPNRTLFTRLMPWLLLAALVAVVVYVGSAWLITRANQSTYCSNIYINGIDVSSFSKEAGMEYVRNEINTRLTTAYTLSWQDQSWSYSAADFGGTIETDDMMERAWNIGHVGNIFDCSRSIRSLKSMPIYLDAPLEYDEDLIDAFVERIYDEIYVAPVDAVVVAGETAPYLLSESTQGQELDRDALKSEIIAQLETGESASTLPVNIVEPSLTTEAAQETLELIVEYKTDVSARGYYSRQNVRKALFYFYGEEVSPGETVDFNDRVGPRTEERGWLPGTEYITGGKTQETPGGGVCQASTTLYGAVLMAGMDIITRSPHSMTVAYVEPSIDAAVTETGSKNLVFVNNTDTSFFIYTDVTEEEAIVRIYGKKPEYRYVLESEVVSQDSTAVQVEYIPDQSGKYAYYTDETALYKKGRAACSSNGWLVAYDWETGEEVSRKQMSFDKYESGTDIYWQGIHPRNETAESTNAAGSGDLGATAMPTDASALNNLTN